VNIRKYRRKVFYGRLRRQIGVILRDLRRQRGIEMVEGHAMPDPVHLCLSIPPKSSVANTIGFLKGKSAVRIHREWLHERRMTGLHFWAAGYGVSPVGLDEARVRHYIREQDEQDRRQGELNLDQIQRPQRGLPHAIGPLGGACLIPRPMAVDHYSDTRLTLLRVSSARRRFSDDEMASFIMRPPGLCRPAFGG
jgi:putative transposase